MTLRWDQVQRDGHSVRQCDLSGHFWAELGRDEPAHAWSVRIFDYENNLMASAAGLTESHAMDVVERWDRDVVHAEADPIPIAKAGMLIRPTDAGPSSA